MPQHRFGWKPDKPDARVVSQVECFHLGWGIIPVCVWSWLPYALFISVIESPMWTEAHQVSMLEKLETVFGAVPIGSINNVAVVDPSPYINRPGAKFYQINYRRCDVYMSGLDFGVRAYQANRRRGSIRIGEIKIIGHVSSKVSEVNGVPHVFCWGRPTVTQGYANSPTGHWGIGRSNIWYQLQVFREDIRTKLSFGSFLRTNDEVICDAPQPRCIESEQRSNDRQDDSKQRNERFGIGMQSAPQVPNEEDKRDAIKGGIVLFGIIAYLILVFIVFPIRSKKRDGNNAGNAPPHSGTD